MSWRLGSKPHRDAWYIRTGSNDVSVGNCHTESFPPHPPTGYKFTNLKSSVASQRTTPPLVVVHSIVTRARGTMSIRRPARTLTSSWLPPELASFKLTKLGRPEQYELPSLPLSARG